MCICRRQGVYDTHIGYLGLKNKGQFVKNKGIKKPYYYGILYAGGHEFLYRLGVIL
jgi:hypothetical protein